MNHDKKNGSGKEGERVEKNKELAGPTFTEGLRKGHRWERAGEVYGNQKLRQVTLARHTGKSKEANSGHKGEDESCSG